MEQQDQTFIELLERWQSGDFTAADERALQRLLADGDEFRRMAAGGYFSKSEEDHGARIARLRERLECRLNPTNDSKRPVWFRLFSIAAAIAVLVVASWWVFDLQKKQAEFARHSNPTPTPDANQTPQIDSGTAAPTNNDYAAKSAPSATQSRDNEGAKMKADRSLDQIPSAASKPLSTFDDLEKKDALGKVAGLAAATPTDAAKNEAEDRIADNVIEEVAVKEQTPPTPLNSYPRETASNGYPAAPTSKQKIPSKKMRDLGNPYPDGGWVQFEQRARNTAILTPQARAANVRGSVTVLVDFDEKSAVKKISVMVSLGYGCDEIAENIIRKSKWVVPGNEKSVIVDIPFEQ